jgi:hypothetical protein
VAAVKATHTPPTTVTITPAVVLRGAARYLQLHGWTQHNYYADECDTYHLPPNVTYSTQTPPACVMGALAIAAYGRRLPTNACKQPEWADYKHAEDVLLAHLGRLYPPASDEDFPEPGLGDWNDQPDRTAAQVITALNSAADHWEHTHAPAVTE